MYEYQAKLKRVVDGDTIDMIIDLGFKMTTEQRIRLQEGDAPETWRQKKDSEEYKAGMATTNFVIERFAANDNEFMIRTTKETGAYGRYLGEIFFKDSDESLNEELIRLGLAVRYR